MSDPYAWLEDALVTIRRADWYRSVRSLQSLPGATILLDGQTLINFASNDYLGLAGDPRLIQAAVQATQTWGTGSTGSRLITGHRDLHRQLEQAIATLKQTEDALVFSSGYLANIGAIAALVGKRDLVLSDQFNHSSLRNGALMSGAKLLDYRHCDIEELRQHLEQGRSQYRRCLILTDSVFSMDGDLGPLPQILDLAEQFESMVLVDEAHGTGVLGANGAGCVEHLGCSGRPLIQMGTLSKALGSLGGYVAGSRSLIDFLRNRAPSWIYTTGLSPADTAAALEAIAIVQTEPQRRQQLWQNVHHLKQGLTQLLDLGCETGDRNDWKILPSDSPILCLQVRDAATALKIAQQLQQAGIFAPAIRPPTVPTSRLRFTLMATHTPDHITQLLTTLTHCLAD